MFYNLENFYIIWNVLYNPAFSEIYRLFRKNMKPQTQVTKTWGRFTPVCRKLRAHETWLPKLLGKYSNPFRTGTQG